MFAGRTRTAFPAEIPGLARHLIRPHGAEFGEEPQCVGIIAGYGQYLIGDLLGAAIGVITMLDGGKNDEKIIAVPFSDPMYNGYRDIEALPSHMFKQIEHFFSVYKDLEGKETAVNPVEGRGRAVKVIEEAIKSYTQKFGEEAPPAK